MAKKERSNKEKLEKRLTVKEKKLLRATIKDRLRAKAKRVKSETKKQLLTALVAAFGFLVALEWREVISGYVAIIEQLSPIHGKIVSALIVTLVAVIGILLATKFLREGE